MAFTKFASITTFISLLHIATLFAQDTSPTTPYRFTLDLTEVVDDEVKVSMLAPKISKKKIEYYIPKVVPGTYSISDFGRFVTKFKAYDKKGRQLPVSSPNANTWVIKKSNKLHRIEYWVADTWDTKKKNVIFEPAGSNIERDRNFMINNFAFFGYFEGMRGHPIEVSFKKPLGFYGSTSLRTTSSNDSVDVFRTENYFDLADAPIMYCLPDTVVMKIGGADVLVSVYSPNDQMGAEFVSENIAEILEAQRKYLGGKLPIDKYAFIIYLTDKSTLSGMIGALEHNHSSLYVLQELPEIYQQYLASSIKDIAAHEFFHILTPLTIHSEEIQYFDYMQPEMSKHLWLYEGVVEYFAGHVQARYQIIDPERYIDIVREKIRNATSYKPNLPFTEMSEGVLEKYEDQYGNVYEKGALIGLCLDIQLRSLSSGKYGLIDLMLDLSKEYGKEKPFRDEELFDKIATVSRQPEIREFFSRYVEGSEPLPLEKTFELVGFNYQAKAIIKEISLGSFTLNVDEAGNLFIDDVSNLDAFGKEMGYQEGDIIRSINGDTVSLENIQEVIGNLRENTAAGDRMTVIVERQSDSEPGTNKMEVKLEGTVINVEREELNFFEPVENPTPEQLNNLRSWLFAPDSSEE